MKGIQRLKEKMINLGIYRKREIQKPAIPYNPDIEKVLDSGTREALREMRFLPDMTKEKYQREICNILDREGEEIINNS